MDAFLGKRMRAAATLVGSNGMMDLIRPGPSPVEGGGDRGRTA
jgi:hypothetical protein